MMPGDNITSSGPQRRRLRFSVDQYYKMIELGMIEDYEKAEIIDGELVQKMTIGDRHALVVDLLTQFFVKSVPDTVRVRVQNPLLVGEFDEPEPDIVLADLTKYDGKRHPRPHEVILLVEVADVSLKYDRDTKLPLYAQAGIPEVWIVNLPNNTVEIHQKPSTGIYQMTKLFRPGNTIETEALPGLKLDASEILV